MTLKTGPSSTVKTTISPFQCFIALLSLGTIISLSAQSLLVVPHEVMRILRWVDRLSCVFFLTDFCIRLHQAPSKRAFLKWGWIDGVSSLPFYGLQYGRALQVARLLRMLRTFKAAKEMARYIIARKQRTQSTFWLVLYLLLLLMCLGAIGVLLAEHHAVGATIKTAPDALWWAMETMTTTGYGDYAPVTLIGRLMGGLLMMFGMGLFAVFTGFFINWFSGDKRAKSLKHHKVTDTTDHVNHD